MRPPSTTRPPVDAEPRPSPRLAVLIALSVLLLCGPLAQGQVAPETAFGDRQIPREEDEPAVAFAALDEAPPKVRFFVLPSFVDTEGLRRLGASGGVIFTGQAQHPIRLSLGYSHSDVDSGQDTDAFSADVNYRLLTAAETKISFIGSWADSHDIDRRLGAGIYGDFGSN